MTDVGLLTAHPARSQERTALQASVEQKVEELKASMARLSELNVVVVRHVVRYTTTRLSGRPPSVVDVAAASVLACHEFEV